MKKLILSVLTPGICLLGSALNFSARAQQLYAVNWYSIAGGGGTATSGVYTVNCTIGQDDATANGALSSSNYTVTDGFWAGISVLQTLGAPPLLISHLNNTVTVYWPNVTGWNLQQNGNLTNSNNWLVNSNWTTLNGTNYLNLNSPTGNLFFRLSSP